MAEAMTWQYVAGFFDGEGHVSVIIRNNNVGLCQAGEEGRKVLNEIAALCHGEDISCGVYPANESGRERPMYRFSIQGRESCRRFLAKVLPYLRVKRVAALDALRFFTLYPPIYGGFRNRRFLRRPGYFIRSIGDKHAFTPRKKKAHLGEDSTAT